MWFGFYDENSVVSAFRTLLEENFSVGWLVGCFGLNSPLKQYLSILVHISDRLPERGRKKREMTDERKYV